MRLLSERVARFSLVRLLVVVSVSTLSAQTVTTGSLSGDVVDQQGAVLPGATVVAVHGPTGTTYESVTGPDGRFQILNIRVGGPYNLTVGLEGFREQTVCERGAGRGQGD